MSMLIDPKSDRWSWVRARQTGIGASEAAAVLGLSPWESPLAVYLRKTGRSEAGEANEAMRIGLVLESALLKLYAERVGIPPGEFRTQVFLRSDAHPVLLATLDGIGPDNRPVELKWSGMDRGDWGPEGTDEIPEHYLIQCQQQMLVADQPEMDLAALVGPSFRVYTIRRDDDLIAAMVPRLAEFWGRVQTRDPDPSWPETASPRELAALFPETGRMRPLDEGDAARVAEYTALGAAIRELEDRRAGLKAAILAGLEGDTGLLPDGRRVRLQEVRIGEHVVRASTQVRLQITKGKP